MAKSRVDLVGAEIARLIRMRREEAGLSMNVLAQKAGLSHSIISRIEGDLRNPTVDTLLRITTAIKIDLWRLIKEAEENVDRPS